MPGYTFLAVPTDLVLRVIEFVEQETAEAPVVPRSNDADDELLGWTETLLERAYNESAEPMGQLLEFLAAHENEEVTADDIALGIHAERGWNTVAGMLGAFSRRCTGRYGRPGFPWEHRWDENGKGQMKMPASIAQIIRSLSA